MLSKLKSTHNIFGQPGDDSSDISQSNDSGGMNSDASGDTIDQAAINQATGQSGSFVSPSTTGTVTWAGSGMVFDNTYESGVSAAYMTAIVAAEHFLESRFTNSITLSVSFSLGVLSDSVSGENDYSTDTVSYVTLVNALRSHATTADDFAAVASLPTTDPSGGEGFSIPLGEARVLGLVGNSYGIDDSVELNQVLPWSWGQDAVGVIEHEISEGEMGRIGGLGIQNGEWGVLDLFRYSSPGQRDYSGGADGQASYFSVDGSTLLTQFHNSVDTYGYFDGMDLGDWDNTVGDAFGPGGPGSPGTVSATDLRVLDILGWTPTSSGAPATPTPPPVMTSIPNPPAAADFNGDGKDDLLWQNTGGSVAEWDMNGLQALTSGVISDGSGWNVVGTGDFNGDGNSDILWQDGVGAVVEWEMSGLQVPASGMIGTGPGWSVVGTGDFTGNGNSDILWQNVSGTVVEWQMNGLQVVSAAVIGGGSGWNIAGIGDFNGDGKSDILWQGPGGSVVEWIMDGFHPTSMQFLGGSTDWSILGTGDFTGDGKSDILWKNSLGTVSEWLMNGTQVVGSAMIGGGSGWNVVGIGDYSGDGKSDILWQNASGTVVGWQMNGTQVVSSGVVTNAGGWKIV